jgi:transposase
MNRPAQVSDLERVNADLMKRIEVLLAEVARLQKALYGQKRERVTNGAQLELLASIIKDAVAGLAAGDPNAEAAANAAIQEMKDHIEGEPKPKAKPDASKRKHGRRDPDTLELPVCRVEIDPADVINDRAAFEKIGEQVSSHVEWLPSSLVRVDVVLNRYRRIGDGFVDISTPEMPIRFIDKSIVGPSFVANMIVNKYGDHIPLDRQVGIFKRSGFVITTSTMCGLLSGATAHLSHITDAMWLEAMKAPYVLTDATGVLVKAKERCTRAHFYAAVVPNKMTLYRFTHKNDGDTVARLFDGFSGVLHADAAAIYHELFRLNPAIVEAGCWAHTRRKFYDAIDEDNKGALTAIGYIRLLYEAHYSSMTDDVVNVHVRSAAAVPVLASMRTWLDEMLLAAKPDTLMHKALGYLDRQWLVLQRFLHDGNIGLDTNPAERALRREAVGRKNWLFLGSDSGAKWNATSVTLIASCAMHDIEPWSYLRDVLILLPAWKLSAVIELAPHRWRETLQQPETQRLLAELRLLGREQGHGPGPATA